MNDRLSAFPSGAPACPFVALEDERDRRATAPDARHRCYAESPARSRPLSHQAAYCISSTFPRCPTFLVWASRAAAAPVPGMAGVEPPANGAGPEAPAAPPAPTQADRLWQTPTPVFLTADMRVTEPSPVAVTPEPDLVGGPGAETVATLAPPAVDPVGEPVVASAAAVPIAVLPMPELGTADPGGQAGTLEVTQEPPRSSRRFLRLTGRDGGAPLPMDAEAPGRLPPQTRSAVTTTGSGEWRGRKASKPTPAVGPRFRVGLVPPAAIGFATLIAVAAVLFLLPGFLAGGGPAPQASPTPTHRPGIAADPTPTRRPRPPRTPFVYIVKPDDTLIRIGRRFHVSVNKIVCASGIRNPNLLTIGQELTIPPPDYQCPGSAGGHKPTPTPRPTAATPASAAPG